MRTAQLRRAVSAPAPAGAAPAAAVAKSGPAAAAVGRAPTGRLHTLRHTTPGRLQLILLTLVILALAAGATAGLTARSAAAGTHDLGARTQPLLLEAETIYTALADADATAAQAFLAGGLEPRELTARYDADLTRAATALASAARRTPSDGRTADTVAALTAGMAEYAGLIATARANNRQGLPVGSSYLSAASSLYGTTLQPQAQSLLTTAQRELDDGYADARSTAWVSLLALLVLALLVGLVLAQLHLSRTTRRTFNIALLAATALTVLLAVGVGAVLNAQRGHLRSADRDGSVPIGLLAEARILALQQRSDEALTLAGRGGSGRHEEDFAAVGSRLTGPGGLFARAADAVPGEARAAVLAAATRHQQYVAAHTAVRKLDDRGDYDGAVELAVGTRTTATFTTLTRELGSALDDRKAAFDREIDAAGRGLGLLTVLGPLLALIICALAVAGIRARLQEYR